MPQAVLFRPPGRYKRGVPGYKQAMRMVLKSNNPVVLSYASDVLEQAGIDCVIFDTHSSIMDGSMAIVPRRLMVLDEDFSRAEALLRKVVPEAMP
jgi:hypothetical protein